VASRIGSHLRTNVVAYVALFLALGMGTAYALERNSVKSKHIVNGHVRTNDVGGDAITSEKVSDGSLNLDDIGNATSTLHGGVDVAANDCEDIVMPAAGIEDSDGVLVFPKRDDGGDADWDSRLIMAGWGPRHADTETSLGGPAVPIRICNTSNQGVDNARLSFYVLGLSS
jgi:hypothetical protein